MAHYSRLGKIVMDVPADHHDQEVTFWEGALGQKLDVPMRHPEYQGTVLHGQDFALLIQRTGTGPARVHVDIHTDDLAAEVARLEQLGAERVAQRHTWWVMRDPAGLLFCVLQDDSGTLTGANAHRWE